MKNLMGKIFGIGAILMAGSFCAGLEVPTDEDYAKANGAPDIPLVDIAVAECAEPCFVEPPAGQPTLLAIESAVAVSTPEKSPAVAQAPALRGDTGAFRAGEWVAVSDENLGKSRGGFDVGQGLTVSFGIVRTVSINGDLVTRTAFTLPDVSKITADQAKLASAALSQAQIVQNGPGNLVGVGIRSQAPSSTVIQNSLNNQTIQTLTVINTDVNSLGMLKTINALGTLKDSLLGSMGIR